MPAADGKVETFQDFEAVRLEQNLLGGIFGYGLERGIVPTAAGRDMLMQAQAGTGKIVAFTIEMLEQPRRRGPAVQHCTCRQRVTWHCRRSGFAAQLAPRLRPRVHRRNFGVGGLAGTAGGPARGERHVGQGGRHHSARHQGHQNLDAGKKVTQTTRDAQLTCVSAAY